MSDRFKGCWVAFEDDLSGESAEKVAEAIRCIRMVQSVDLRVTNIDDYMNRERCRNELGQKLMKVLYPKMEE